MTRRNQFWVLITLITVFCGFTAYQSIYIGKSYDRDTWSKDRGGVWLIETSDGSYINTSEKMQWSHWFKTKTTSYIPFRRDIESEIIATTKDGLPVRTKLRTTLYVPFNERQVISGDDNHLMVSLKSKIEEQYRDFVSERPYSAVQSTLSGRCWARCYNAIENDKSDSIKQDLRRLNAEWGGYVEVAELIPSF